jgi:hypothetical protein
MPTCHFFTLTDVLPTFSCSSIFSMSGCHPSFSLAFFSYFLLFISSLIYSFISFFLLCIVFWVCVIFFAMNSSIFYYISPGAEGDDSLPTRWLRRSALEKICFLTKCVTFLPRFSYRLDFHVHCWEVFSAHGFFRWFSISG